MPPAVQKGRQVKFEACIRYEACRTTIQKKIAAVDILDKLTCAVRVAKSSLKMYGM